MDVRSVCNTLMHHVALALSQVVAQGSALARKGAVAEAISKFNRAKELDSELTLDAAARANQLS